MTVQNMLDNNLMERHVVIIATSGKKSSKTASVTPVSRSQDHKTNKNNVVLTPALIPKNLSKMEHAKTVASLQKPPMMASAV